MFPLRVLILVLSLAAPFSAQASASQKNSPSWEESRNSLYARLHKLSPFEQKLMILVVYGDADKNSNSLANSTPEEISGSFKVLSVEHRLLADLSKEVHWIEMGKWFQGNSDSLVAVVRGEKTLRQFKADMELRKVPYQRMVQDFKDQNYKEGLQRPSSAFNKLRPELATYVGATARIYTWGRKKS